MDFGDSMDGMDGAEAGSAHIRPRSGLCRKIVEIRNPICYSLRAVRRPGPAGRQLSVLGLVLTIVRSDGLRTEGYYGKREAQ
jgi:hypothetical protein